MIAAGEVRQLALSLPQVDEREIWGKAAFRVRDEIFVTIFGEAANVRVSSKVQDELVALDRETFSVADSTCGVGWVTVQLDTVEPDLMRELVVEAWRRTAPRRLVTAYDAQR